jgi:DNA-binding GntR family transcriptional regulator
MTAAEDHGAPLGNPDTPVERVVHSILTRIASGDLGPGEQLRQEELAEMIGVSRVPVREALHALADQRVLVHEKRRGFFVAKRSSHELAQLARLIVLVEEEVITSVEWPDDATLDRLRSINDRLLGAIHDPEAGDTYTLNHDFHFTIFRLSALTIMVDELERLWRLARRYMIAEMLTVEARRQRVDEHQDLIDQLAARDREGLLAAQHAHQRRGRMGGLKDTGITPARSTGVGEPDSVTRPVLFLSSAGPESGPT